MREDQHLLQHKLDWGERSVNFINKLHAKP